MKINYKREDLYNRTSPFEMTPDEFRRSGYQLVDLISEFIGSISRRKVTQGEPPEKVRSLLNSTEFPEKGLPADILLKEAADLLFNHSLFNGHPKFWGYITSSCAPVGALSDLLAAAVNPNVGAWALSPIATEIESQSIRWLAEMLGYPEESGGILVSGGTMANFVGLLAARTLKLSSDLRENGISNQKRPVIYCSKASHTWVEKGSDIFGLGTKSIRWVDVNENQQMNIEVLEQQIKSDINNNFFPFLVIGNLGTVGTGAIDPLQDIGVICEKYKLWFHLDGAYGAPAVVLPELSDIKDKIKLADSIAVDPHKWLYCPLEVGCALVKNPKALIDTFSFHPDYYNFDAFNGEQVPVNYHEFGPQNSRGFRALKLWLGIRQAGKAGFIKSISDDIALAKELYILADNDPELQAFSHNLSITTFRFIPAGIDRNNKKNEQYLNDLNMELLNRLQTNGEVFLSNAVVDGKYFLRVCIVNFRTTLQDIEALPEIVTRTGRKLDSEMRPENVKYN